MEQIDNIINWIQTNITTTVIIDIIIAICIFAIFRIFRKKLAYITVKIFKPRIKQKKEIKNNSFYAPLKIFYQILGLYLAILFLKNPLKINEFILLSANKIFKISIMILVANGIANSLTVNNKIVNRLKEKMNPDVEDTMLNFILKAVRVLIYIIAAFLAIIELGYDLSGLVTGLGIGGVVVTLAAQDTAQNLFGGLVIFLDKPFTVGDWIQVDKYEGTVEDITFRSTRVRIFENSVVNIPNSVIANDSITNWSRMEQRRNRVNLCLDRNTPLEKVRIVQERIKAILMQNDKIIDDTIIVRFDNITDNGINLMVSSYTNSIGYESFLEEKEKINFKIMQILNEENVKLAYDTKTVFVKS